MRNEKLHFAFFVTSHGFGHATRACAVIEAMHESFPCRFSIFSSLPDWFWTNNLNNIHHELYDAKTDVGLIQKDPFTHDLEKTLVHLLKFLSFDDENFHYCLAVLRAQKPVAIMCDISPLGLKIGDILEIPTILIENFTWDWIYEFYEKELSQFSDVRKSLLTIFRSAELRIQAIPFCEKVTLAEVVDPIHRKLGSTKEEVRERLGIPEEHSITLVTTGGIVEKYEFVKELEQVKGQTFILTGNYSSIQRSSNILELPIRNSFNFQDLVRSSDLVVGKVGYGTAVECWAGGTSLLPVYREHFRESAKMRAFVLENLSNREISMNEFLSGNWIGKNLDLSPPLSEISLNNRKNGSLQVANLVISFLHRQSSLPAS